MDQWSKITTNQKRDSDTLQYGVPIVARLVNFVFWMFIHFKDIFEIGESFVIIFFSLFFFFPYSK